MQKKLETKIHKIEYSRINRHAHCEINKNLTTQLMKHKTNIKGKNVNYGEGEKLVIVASTPFTH